MSVTAKFVADFASFTTAVEKAEVQLKDMETGANKVSSSLSKMTDALSGRKLITDATLAAEAVERIGGTSKLTAAELASVQAKATAAAEKLQALGQDVPPSIQKITDTVKSTGGALESIKGTLGSVAGAFGIAFSVGAVVNFGKQVIETASHINDLSSQLGISTDAVQGFKFAAEQSGSSLDTVGTAINKMNVNLAGGEKSTIKALKDAGLEFNNIRNLKPEDAFLAITDAIQGIPDPMRQADVAVALFGKNGAELLPAIKQGFRDVSDAASKMSADTIESLDEAGDAWDKLTTRITNTSGTILANALHTVDGITDSWKAFGQFVDNTLKFGIGAAAAMADVQDRAAKAAAKNRDVFLDFTPPVKQLTQAELDAAAATKRHAEALESLFSKFSGKTANAQIKDLDTVFRRMASSGQITEKQIDAIVKEAIKLQNEGGKLTQRLLDMVTVTGALSPGLSTTAINFKEMGDQVAIVEPKISDLWRDLAKPPVEGIANLKFELSNLIAVTPETMLKGVLVKTHDVNKALGELATSFAQLSQIAGGSLGEIVRRFGEMVASVDTANKSLKTIKESAAALKSGETLAGIAGMATGILGIASAAIQAGKAIAGLFDRNKGRDLVEEFAGSQGGFDALHAQLLKLGDEGEQLWIKLTQGVGRNNPSQAQAAIAEVTAALAKQEAQSGDVAAATEEQAVATIETASQAQAALDKLGVRLNDNIIEWDQWGKDVRAVIDTVAQAIRTMPLPTAAGVSGSGLGTVAPSAQSGGFRPYEQGGYTGGYMPVTLMMPDGQVLAEQVVRVSRDQGLS